MLSRPQGTMRVLLVLLHDFPELLCDYHYAFCDVIPSNCIQVRNLILSAFPRSMRLPDPFTPNLKVDILPEIANAPRIMSNFVAMIHPPQLKKVRVIWWFCCNVGGILLGCCNIDEIYCGFGYYFDMWNHFNIVSILWYVLFVLEYYGIVLLLWCFVYLLEYIMILFWYCDMWYCFNIGLGLFLNNWFIYIIDNK